MCNDMKRIRTYVTRALSQTSVKHLNFEFVVYFEYRLLIEICGCHRTTLTHTYSAHRRTYTMIRTMVSICTPIKWSRGGSNDDGSGDDDMHCCCFLIQYL